DGRLHFSEIARMAGVAYTNWSWGALFADLDNDGLKDLFVTNGFPKAANDLDYQTSLVRARRISEKMARDLLNARGRDDVPNYVFQNDGDLTFTDRTREWGLGQPSSSNGAAYADLNADGRLDLVVNNIDAPASIYENVAPRVEENHYLQVRLQGEPPNTRGLGAKVILTAGGRKQYVEQTPYRGYMSTVDDRLHFGLGRAARVDTLEVIWPDGRCQLLSGLPVDRSIILRQRDATGTCAPEPSAGGGGRRIFRPVAPDSGLKYEDRQEDSGSDYSVQALLPYQISQQGPPIAVGDVDRDGLEDVFVGGAAGVPGRLFLQQSDGRFVQSAAPQPWEVDPEQDDWGALFFDANGDGLPDLYVASGGYRLAPSSRRLQDRLYLNRGHGRFVEAAGALPPMLTSTAAVRAADFTGDGRLDLFVGGRLTPGHYPIPTRSYLLRNDGGHFTDVTAQMAPELLEPGGMITDAVWMDFNGDGRPDLVTAGEWMPIEFFANEGGRLRDVTASMHLPPMRGWWYRLAVGDLNHDGRPDLVAGNLGLNYSYTTSKESRFGVYAGNFSGYRRTDIVFTQEIDGTEYPYYGLALLGRDNALLAARAPTYRSFAEASVEEAFGPEPVRGALHYQADTFASVWLRNDGNGRFTPVQLPNSAQVSTIRGILVDDFDGDGNADLLVAGNTFDTEANSPRADAGEGLLLKGDGRGHFTPVPPTASGFRAALDVRNLALVHTRAGRVVVVANHGGPLQAFAVRGSGQGASSHSRSGASSTAR
ncbi:MAG TPA: VCBS repeat-containing protein, partial [Longimicrobiaceae bacterium]|nr:VCBS repeat-containing protein [Longimicrobiaceae bacterium]